jgi:hypothetical protein
MKRCDVLDVDAIGGTFTFAWDPVNNVAGEHADLPNSASVTVYGTDSALPEPSSIVLGGIAGLIGLGIALNRCRRNIREGPAVHGRRLLVLF